MPGDQRYYRDAARVQGSTWKSTRRSIRSAASSLPVPTIASRDPTPWTVILSFRFGSISTRSWRMRSARANDRRSFNAAGPDGLAWPVKCRQVWSATVRRAITLSQSAYGAGFCGSDQNAVELGRNRIFIDNRPCEN